MHEKRSAQVECGLWFWFFADRQTSAFQHTNTALTSTKSYPLSIHWVSCKKVPVYHIIDKKTCFNEPCWERDVYNNAVSSFDKD